MNESFEFGQFHRREAKKITCFGYSYCRLCGCENGSESFSLENWEWPQGFRHYLVDHLVRPSPEFDLFISEWMLRRARFYKWLDAQFETSPPYFKGLRWFVPAVPETEDRNEIPCSVGFVNHLKGGQFCLMTNKCKDGQQLAGANNYRLRVPANAPVKEQWTVTAYDCATHTPIREWTHRTSKNLGSQKSADGSAYIFFGPVALAGKEGNWVITDPARPFEVMFCLYTATQVFSEKKWVLPDIDSDVPRSLALLVLSCSILPIEHFGISAFAG
jgi:hypothetical protein